jgi:site-specific recombinase XerD
LYPGKFRIVRQQTITGNALPRRVVEAAGLNPDQVVRHTLRHTAITHLVQAGVDLPTVKRISGHKTLAMVERYAHQNGAHIEGAMDRLQNRLKLAP